MGANVSTPSASPQATEENQCVGFTNDQIAYRTKQFVILKKAIDEISPIAEGRSPELDVSDPTFFLIDTRKVLPDLQPGVMPSTVTLDIFEPKRTIVGIYKGKPEERYLTVIDQYNKFFVNDYRILTSEADRIARAKLIHDNLVLAAEKSFEHLMAICNDIGRVDKSAYMFGKDSINMTGLSDYINQTLTASKAGDTATVNRLMEEIGTVVPPEVTQEIIYSLTDGKVTDKLKEYLSIQ